MATATSGQTEKVQLILDVRERDLGIALTKLGVPYTTAALDVGDFLIQKDNGEPLLVAERKSHADFAASNTDGRYREQRARLMGVRGGGVAVLYILEGIWTESEARRYGAVTEAQLKRLTTRLTLRYCMPVLAADSILDTARWCRVLLAQLTDDPTVFHPEGDMATATTAALSSMTAVLSATKKGNKTVGGSAAAMLSGIPGLGGKRIEALLTERSVAELAGLSLTEIAALQAGGKRIGDKLATTIHEALHYRNANSS